MAVISFASLKGGVGKTSCAVNIAQAFAKRGCEVLFIDLDPSAHATRFFRLARPQVNERGQAPLERLFLSDKLEGFVRKRLSALEAASSLGIKLDESAKKGIRLIPGGPDLDKLGGGRGGQITKGLFARLIQELSRKFDFVVMDTAPQFSALTEAALAASSLIVVPVDSSLMSIWSLEELVQRCDHLGAPTVAILRTMVNRQASRIRAIAEARLHDKLPLVSPKSVQTADEPAPPPIEDFNAFIGRLTEYESVKAPDKSRPGQETAAPGKPIYLLDSSICRTEQHNKLTFLGNTAFDRQSTRDLAAQYTALAREIEKLISIHEEAEDFEPPAEEDEGLCQDERESV